MNDWRTTSRRENTRSGGRRDPDSQECLCEDKGECAEMLAKIIEEVKKEIAAGKRKIDE